MYFQILSAIHICKQTIRDDKINQFSFEIKPNDRVDRSEIELERKPGEELETWIQKPVELEFKGKYHWEVKLEGEDAINCGFQFTVEFNGEYQGKCFGFP